MSECVEISYSSKADGDFGVLIGIVHTWKFYYSDGSIDELTKYEAIEHKGN